MSKLTLTIIGFGLIALFLSLLSPLNSWICILFYGGTLVYYTSKHTSKLEDSMDLYRVKKNTQIKKVEERVVFNESILNTVVKTMSTPIIFVNKGGMIDFINKSFQPFLSNDDVIGKPYSKIVHGELLEVMDICYLYEERYNAVHKINDRYFQVDSRPLFVHHIYQGSVILFNDVSKFKEVENMQKMFLSNVSHELKTPMSAIIGSVEILSRQRTEVDDTTKAFLDILLKESTRMQHIVDDILALSRLEQSDLELKPVSIDCNTLVTDTIHLFTSLADKKDLKISFDTKVCNDLFLDYASLKTIITNLLSNAIKYSNQGTIHVLVDYYDKMLELIIQDEGVGISKENVSLVFDRFFQEDRSRSGNTGTGLGLSIVKRVVELNHGTIVLESTVDQGSRFIVKIPTKIT